jgi:hypothetical protein
VAVVMHLRPRLAWGLLHSHAPGAGGRQPNQSQLQAMLEVAPGCCTQDKTTTGPRVKEQLTDNRVSDGGVEGRKICGEVFQ